MKHTIASLLVSASLCMAFNAYGLDASDSVKVTPLLNTTSSWDGKPLVYPQGKAEMTSLLIELAPGAETGWHEHPVPSFAVVLSGSLEVRLQDGRVKRVEAGEVLAEVVDTAHNGRNASTIPLRLVVFYAGVVDKPLTLKHNP